MAYGILRLLAERGDGASAFQQQLADRWQQELFDRQPADPTLPSQRELANRVPGIMPPMAGSAQQLQQRMPGPTPAEVRERGDTSLNQVGRGVLGFVGGLLNQIPETQAIMRAGRSGLMAARGGQALGGPHDDQRMDFGEAFLGVGPSFGFQPGPAPSAGSRPPPAPVAPQPMAAVQPGPAQAPPDLLPQDYWTELLAGTSDPFRRYG